MRIIITTTLKELKESLSSGEFQRTYFYKPFGVQESISTLEEHCLKINSKYYFALIYNVDMYIGISNESNDDYIATLWEITEQEAEVQDWEYAIEHFDGKPIAYGFKNTITIKKY